MATKSSSKSYTIFSDNPKMDTSGMAGKPRPLPAPSPYEPPPMTIDDIMEDREMKTNKRPEAEDSNMRCGRRW